MMCFDLNKPNDCLVDDTRVSFCCKNLAQLVAVAELAVGFEVERGAGDGAGGIVRLVIDAFGVDGRCGRSALSIGD